MSMSYPGLSPIDHAWFKYHPTASLGENPSWEDEDFITSSKSGYNHVYLLLIIPFIIVVFIFPFNVIRWKSITTSKGIHMPSWNLKTNCWQPAFLCVQSSLHYCEKHWWESRGPGCRNGRNIGPVGPKLHHWPSQFQYKVESVLSLSCLVSREQGGSSRYLETGKWQSFIAPFPYSLPILPPSPPPSCLFLLLQPQLPPLWIALPSHHPQHLPREPLPHKASPWRLI